MEKTILDERIKKEALNKLYKEWSSLYNFLRSNEIANKLNIHGLRLVGGGGAEQQFFGENFPMRSDGKELSSEVHSKTNFEEALKLRLVELEQKELGDILSKLSNLAYLFNE